MKQKTTLDLTQGPVLRGLFLFALPLMLNTLVNTLYSTADTVMMGRFAGTGAMAAVGASAHPIGLVVNLFAGIALGVNVNCGNLKGARKTRELADCMHTCLLLGLASGLLIMFVGIPLCRPLLASLDTPADILDQAVLYMNIRLAFGPVWMLALFSTYIFYGNGDTKLPTVVTMVSGLVNVGLNAVFVLCFGMGVEGVALATGISQLVSCMVKMILLFSPKGPYRMSVSKLRLHGEYVKKVLSVGIPSGLNSIVFSISNVLLQSCVNSFGTVVVAGNTAADNAVQYVNLVITSMGSACLSATAQCYGAGKIKRMDEIVKKALIGCTVLVLILDIPVTLFGKNLLMVFDENPEVAAMGYPKLMFCCWGYLLSAPMQVCGGCLRGIRKATVALVCNTCGSVIPRLFWLWLVVPLMHTPMMLYLIYPISWAIAAALLVGSFYHYRRKLIVKEAGAPSL